MNRKLKFRAWINENYESFHADQSCYNENDELRTDGGDGTIKPGTVTDDE